MNEIIKYLLQANVFTDYIDQFNDLIFGIEGVNANPQSFFSFLNGGAEYWSNIKTIFLKFVRHFFYSIVSADNNTLNRARTFNQVNGCISFRL